MVHLSVGAGETASCRGRSVVTTTSAATKPTPAPTTRAPAATGADLAHAHRLLDEAEALLRRWDTPLEAALLAVVDRRLTDEVATMVVRLRRDGIATLLVNPAFVDDVGAEGTAFVLCHEALHLLLAHLRYQGERDEAWRLACEVVINHWVTRATGRPLPRSRATGEPTGVDPLAVHDRYAGVVTDPVPYAAFVRTDEGCAGHLRRMNSESRLPSPACDHHLIVGDGSDEAVAGGAEGLTGGAGAAVDEVLEQAVTRALDGDNLLRQRLLDLEGLVPDSRVWGRIGISELRATTSRVGSTRLWQTQLAHVLGRTLEPDLQVRYDRKVGWWDAPLLAPLGITLDPDVGMPLQLTAGTTRRREVAIYLDTSGSVDAAIVEAIAATVGRVPDTTVHWRSFDHAVHPFEPGDPIVGGGGTSFEPVVDDVAALDAELDGPLDAVVVLTDGWGEPVHPPDQQRWIWLVLAHGDPWPRDHGMRIVVVPDLAGT